MLMLALARGCRLSFSPSSCSAHHASRSIAGRISGTRLRPHCSQAAIAIFCHCWSFLFRRSLSSLTPQRSEKSGVMRLTPSSIDFWIVNSIFSPRDITWPRWICNGDSRSSSSALSTFTSTLFLLAWVISASNT
ncbi:hypothetical protein SDC9_169777 [bioreactor metagenome]|uniref:Uncharacterized protein n=1 Tax=bioreactor metagenome TaxID=1076179 RepID=A0A645GEG9_9ZZZZ